MNGNSAIYPKNRKEAIIWNYMNNQDYFYKIREWPDHLKPLGMTHHLDYQSRSRYLYFLLHNGCNPMHAYTMILRGRNFDKSAMGHINSILSTWEYYQYRTWDMKLGKTRPIGPFKTRPNTLYKKLKY